MKRQHPEAQRELKRALELNPSYSQAYLAIGMSYAYSGLAEEAVEPLDTGMRLSPHDEYMGPFMARMAEAYLFMRNHEKAAEWGRRAALQPNLPWPGYASLVSILGHLGLTEELANAIPELEKRAPKTDLTFIRKQLPITHESDLDHFIDGLRKAGLTDE
jgi:tetratricopeptide (TPR) repeat protein